MFRRASDKIRISDFDFSAVNSTQAKPAETACISLSTSDHTITGGFAQPTFAIMPDKHMYQKLRFTLEAIGAGVTGGPSALEVTLWERTPDGEVIPAGVFELQADGTFTDVEIDNHDARYAVTLSTLTGGTTPAITAGVWVQGVYAPTYIAANG